VKKAAKAKLQGSPEKNRKTAAAARKITRPAPPRSARSAAQSQPKAGSFSMDKNSGGDSADRNVDQIRDILFGGQMRDYERRFQEMIQKLDLETQRLRDDFERRSGAIEKRLDEQLEKLLKQLRQEVNDRGQALDDLESRVQQAARTSRTEVNNTLASLQQDMGRSDERLRAAVAELNAAIKQLGDASSGALSGARDELRAEKLSREDLAAMLTEVALRLKGQFDLPVSR
jgi:uncharacterized protein YukE